YALEGCFGWGGGDTLRAGSIVMAADLRLHLYDLEGWHHASIEAQVTLSEACAAPSECKPPTRRHPFWGSGFHGGWWWGWGHHHGGDDDDDHGDGDRDDDGHDHDGHDDDGQSGQRLSAAPAQAMGCSAVGSMVPLAIAALLLLLFPRPAHARSPKDRRP